MNSASSIIIVLILSVKIIFPQDRLEEQLSKAKVMYTQGEYYNTITELKRLIYFDKDKRYAYISNELIGECYKMGGKFTDALNYFTKAEMSAVTPEEIYTCRINEIKINILRRTAGRAISLLDALENDQRFFSKKKDIDYWRGWAYIFEDEWDKASVQFSKSSTKELKVMCDSIDNERYSVTKAKLLSYFIPGSGQIYTGHYFSGLLSLGWNILWGYTTVRAFHANRIFDGIMVGELLWLRFYNGNNQNAEKFAIERNLEISNSALLYLQSKYQGEKP
jgi:tetratricopeptide (TPR) repeat protein